MPKQIFGPNGEVWAAAPDDTWNLRGEPWPEPGVLVEVCWASRFLDPTKYGFGEARLVSWHMDGKYAMSSWVNEEGSQLVINPDYWRPIQLRNS